MCLLDLVWTLSTRPHSKSVSNWVIQFRDSCKLRGHSCKAFSSIFLPTPYLSLYHYLCLLHSACLYNATTFIVCFLGAVYKVFSVLLCAGVYMPEPFATQKQVLGCCFRAFHTDNMLLLNTTPTKQFSRKTHTETYAYLDNTCAKFPHIHSHLALFKVTPSTKWFISLYDKEWKKALSGVN